MVMVDGAIPTLTNFHFSGGTLLYVAIIAPFRISVPKKKRRKFTLLGLSLDYYAI